MGPALKELLHLENPTLTKKRGENESFKAYKLRMKREKKDLNEFKKGKFFHYSRVRVKGGFQVVGNTYVAPKRKKATA